jgi:hypothetical protein
MEEHTNLPMERGSVAADVLYEGKAMQQVSTGFSTAVVVQKPRNRKDIIKACEEEAIIAGDDFYYAWTVNETQKDGSKKPKLVEGPGIGLAQAAARNWGNCAIMMTVEETVDSFIFTPTFIDLETGFNLQRAFRQAKAKNVGKKYSSDRAEDMIFQIGQSKATRNLIINALPNWLINKTMEAAKQNVIAKIEKLGVGPAKERLLDWFEKKGIAAERIEAKLDKKQAVWQLEDLALLFGAMNSIIKGQELPEDLFPPTKPEPVKYDLPEDILKSIDIYCEALGINEAEKSMALGGCKGDAKKATAYRDELMKKVADKEKAEKKGLFEGGQK